MKQIIRLTEGDLHRIVKESVKRVLNEVAGYEKTMLKANSPLSRIGRLFNPKKARQFKRIHDNAKQLYDKAWIEDYANRADTELINLLPKEEYEKISKELNKDYDIMHKYRVGKYGRRKYGIADYEI